MGWHFARTHDWQTPIDFAAAWAGADMALLYSSREQQGHAQSFLLLDPMETYTGSAWQALPPLPTGESTLPEFVGYLGYGMRHDMEPSTRDGASIVDLPDFMLIRYKRLFRFDHIAQTINEFVNPGLPRDPAMALGRIARQARVDIKKIKNLASNFTREGYERTIRATLKKIAAGDFYQANITRKFFGEFAALPNYFSIFRHLCEISPAPYSAYIRHGDIAIISSSPETFLRIDGDSTVTSRPIKGSAPRGMDEAGDAALRYALSTSAKNQAENLMIVDLMRHDLSQVTEPGSVKVRAHAALQSYATIHHLVSTITARKLAATSAYDVTRACFPPGSMTGAPKIAAMAWCAAQEKMKRGVYSGVLGWFGTGGRCELSVVIRTLICQGNRFEFQVGGGIVADSTPTEEWRETLVKARGIARALGIDERELEKL